MRRFTPTVRSLSLAVALLLVTAGTGLAAPPAVPAQLSYQGVLLDDQGDPRTGNVDLVVRIYDALGGGATLIYTQRFDLTPLDQGVFSIVIGPTGELTDTPDDPLTTSLGEVFTGDLVAAPGRFAELTVDGDAAQARIQILSAPLALRAQSAENADSADTAIVSESVVAINGLDSNAINQMYQHFSFDGALPANDDPSEGLADTDGDGLANFVDSDNDDDGLPDGTEVGQGSDINLVTPSILGTDPFTIDFGVPSVVTVTGTHFESGMSVVLGSESPTPTNLSPTSFQVTVGPQAAGLANLQVTRTNGESALEIGAVQFALFTPTVVDVAPGSGAANQAQTVTVTGSNFEPGVSVSFGSQNPTPSNLTSTSFDVVVGPQDIGLVDVTVTRINGQSGVGVGLYEFTNPLFGIQTTHGTAGPYTSFDVAASGASVIGNRIDPEADRTWGLAVVPGPSSQLSGPVDIGFAPSGILAGVVPFKNAGVCEVQLRVDTNANSRLFNDEAVVIESFGVSGCAVPSASLAFLSDDTAVAAYGRSTGGVLVAVDRNGDDDYVDPGEIIDLAPAATDVLVAADVDPTDGIGVVHRSQGGGGFEVRLAHDRNADGDFDDAAENQLLLSDSVDCLDVTFDGSGRAAIVYAQTSAVQGPTLLHDLNGDGDFDDAGEQPTLPLGSSGGTCALTSLASGLAVIATTNDGVAQLLADVDSDGAFTSPGEMAEIDPASGAEPVDITRDATGTRLFGVTPNLFVESMP